MTLPPRPLATLIRNEQQRKRLTDAQAAQALKISLPRYRALKSGKTIPRVKIQERINAFFNLTMEQIAKGINTTKCQRAILARTIGSVIKKLTDPNKWDHIQKRTAERRASKCYDNRLAIGMNISDCFTLGDLISAICDRLRLQCNVPSEAIIVSFRKSDLIKLAYGGVAAVARINTKISLGKNTRNRAKRRKIIAVTALTAIMRGYSLAVFGAKKHIMALYMNTPAIIQAFEESRPKVSYAPVGGTAVFTKTADAITKNLVNILYGDLKERNIYIKLVDVVNALSSIGIVMTEIEILDRCYYISKFSYVPYSDFNGLPIKLLQVAGYRKHNSILNGLALCSIRCDIIIPPLIEHFRDLQFADGWSALIAVETRLGGFKEDIAGRMVLPNREAGALGIPCGPGSGSSP